MKIGRNAPCPCGSGKKYKKCCLKKNVTQPETLQYRRLSAALNDLMPKLIDHGISVFGEMAVDFARAEFFGWPDPDEMPGEDTIDRSDMLFWPWFVFNWEYDRLEDEDNLLDGPEERTIAELFTESKSIKPKSPEGKLLSEANRSPYSFLEIINVRPGESVMVRDVLTGTEMNVQECLGSEVMKTGDILFAGTARVDDVGMFIGLSAYVLPPRMKPQLIELRRALIRGTGKDAREELYEWDLEIREVFLSMDHALHTPPELRNTDGDPMEFHKLIYDIDSPDIAVEKLSSLCVTETVEEIRGTADKNKDGTIQMASFEWNRLGHSMSKEMPNTVLGHIAISENRMTVTVNSAWRAKTIQKEIKKRLGKTARLRLDEITDTDAMMTGNDGIQADTNQLMEKPEIQQQLDHILRAHWETWVDQEIPALGYKTPRQSVRSADGREAVEALLLDAEKTAGDDPGRSAIEKPILADVRKRLKLDRPLSSKKSSPSPAQLIERIALIKTRITEYSDIRLNDIYTEYARNLCEAVAGSNLLNIHRGSIDIWAAAIIYAIAQLNFLFSKETPNYLAPDELCRWYKVKKSTVSNKASMIRRSLDLFYDDERYCAPHFSKLFQFIEDERGFIFPATVLDPEEEGRLQPVPLKPGHKGEKGKAEKVIKKNTQTKKKSDRQLSLFKD